MCMLKYTECTRRTPQNKTSVILAVRWVSVNIKTWIKDKVANICKWKLSTWKTNALKLPRKNNTSYEFQSVNNTQQLGRTKCEI